MQSSLFGLEIGRDVTIGYGVYFVHTQDRHRRRRSHRGPRPLLRSNTVGTAKDNGYPTLEEDVWVGAGARILGPIRIGARARIGANAVVLTDVPADGGGGDPGARSPQGVREKGRAGPRRVPRR